MSEISKQDPRTRRTRDALGNAIIQLIQQQPFDDITVQQILDLAHVSRTTFYTHFVDKHDLLLSDVEDFFHFISNHLTRSSAPARRLAPVTELFTHVAEMRPLYQALFQSEKSPEVRALALGLFARSFAERLPAAGVTLPALELQATTHALAGTLLSLLDWWLAQPTPTPAREMDTLFHRLAWKGFRQP